MAVELSPGELALLGRCPLFQGAEDALLLRVLAAPEVWAEKFSAGDTLYQPARFLRCLGVLLSGQVRVTNESLWVSVLEPGDLFGAAALYNDAPRFATTLTAKVPCRALFLPQDTLDSLLAEEPVLRRNYLGYLTGRIRFLSGRLQAATQSGAEAKLARYLLANSPGGTLHGSAAGLARRLGFSRATLYRAFAALETDGMIRREGKTVYLLDRDGLENI